LFPEIYVSSGSVTATYSDIQGGWAGEGNINSDPLFCNPGNGDYSLGGDSPCVGAGQNGTNMGAFGMCDGSPEITSITDIINDQGEWVYIEFERSYVDMSTPRSTESYTIERMDGEIWVSLHSILAYGAESYITEARTLMDSSANTDGITYFRIIAGMDEGTWISEPDSGYSVDNIAPSAPEGLNASSDENEIVLTWFPNDDDDFHYFILEKATDSEFDDYETIETIDTTYTDIDYELNVTYYYRIAAVDYSDNISGYSEIVQSTLLNVAPMIANIADSTINEDGQLLLTISAESQMGYAMSFSAASDTADVIAGVSNDTLTLTPAAHWHGSALITVVVTDENSLSDTTSFVLTVTPVNDAPIITAIDSITIDEDSSAAVNLSAMDVEEDTLAFSISADTSVITTNVDGTNLTLTPEANWNGLADITVIVTDGSLSDTTSFVLSVTPVNDAPFFTMVFDDTVGAGDSITIMIQADDIDSQDLTYSVSGQPEWLILDGAILSGISPVDSLFVFEISVSDGVLLTTEDFHLVVKQFKPVITEINDVPDDQGGRVYINFQKSFFDNDSLSRIPGYQVERLDDVDWVDVGTYNAYGADNYIIEVNTLFDSSSSTDGMTIFRVIANMEEGNFESTPTSGYSVDNIAPAIPAGLFTSLSENEIVLTWLPNNDEDIEFYGIYKSTLGGFNPDTMAAYTYSTSDTSYIDTLVTLGITYYYRLTAFDHHGNESGYSEQTEMFLSVEEEVLPIEFALHQNYPNPFNPVTTLRYDLPEQANVNIIIYDMLGRQVKTLVNLTQDAGFRSVIWDATNDYGKPVSAGVYLYQIQTGKYVQTRKMVLLK
jgi:fibronectin type 3 domain-containing protein